MRASVLFEPRTPLKVGIGPGVRTLARATTEAHAPARTCRAW